MLKALLWDVDGTLAETEFDGHLVAFNQAFAQLGLPWCWTEQRYGELLAITGGRERLLHDLRSQPWAPVDAGERTALAERVHALKNACYARIVADGLIALRPGVRELFDDCARSGIAMAIVTTTSRANVVALLDAQLGSGWPAGFAVVVCGEDVARKKPDPQAYRAALDALQLDAADTLAIEDAPAGVAAASAAGVPVVVTHSRFFPMAPAAGSEAAPLSAALAAGPSLGDAQGWQPALAGHTGRIGLPQLRHWHGAARPASPHAQGAQPLGPHAQSAQPLGPHAQSAR